MDPRKRVLTDTDHRNLERLIARLVGAYAARRVTLREMTNEILHAVAAVDAGHVGEARAAMADVRVIEEEAAE